MYAYTRFLNDMLMYNTTNINASHLEIKKYIVIIIPHAYHVQFSRALLSPVQQITKYSTNYVRSSTSM